jgi:hypothetical protein
LVPKIGRQFFGELHLFQSIRRPQSVTDLVHRYVVTDARNVNQFFKCWRIDRLIADGPSRFDELVASIDTHHLNEEPDD